MTVTWMYFTTCASHLVIGNRQGLLSIAGKLFSLKNSIPLMVHAVDHMKMVLSFQCDSMYLSPLSATRQKENLLNHHLRSVQSVREIGADTGPEHLAPRTLTWLSPPAQLLGTRCQACSFQMNQCKFVIIIILLSLKTLGTNWVHGFPTHSSQQSSFSVYFYFSETSRRFKRVAFKLDLNSSWAKKRCVDVGCGYGTHFVFCQVSFLLL